MIDFHGTLPPEMDKVTLTELAFDRFQQAGDRQVQYHEFGWDVGSVILANSSDTPATELNDLSLIGSALVTQINPDYRKYFAAGYVEAVGFAASLDEAMEVGATL